MFSSLPKRPPIPSNSCVICGLKTTLGCSQCKQVYYCSAEHQRQHWPTHQQNCNVPKQEPQKVEEAVAKNPLQKSKQESSLNPRSEKKVLEKQINEKEHLQEEHEKYRQIAIRLISQKEYQDALITLKKAIDIATKLESMGDKEDFYEKIADITLLGRGILSSYIRVYINICDFENARRVLKAAFESISVLAKTTNKQDQSRISQVLMVLAQLFYQTGDQRNCELAYVDYTNLIESCHGESSQQTGNAYFTVGVFYLQHKHYTQALACFKRAVNIRMSIRPDDERVSDCWYNMGVIYKQQGKKDQSIEFLEKALKLRRQVIGENSMQVAMCLEALGKLHLNSGDLKQAYSRLQDCFNIRKSLIKDPSHPDLERISKLIVVLYQKTQEQIGGHRNSRIYPQMSQMLEKLSAAVIENNLNKFMDVDAQESMDPFFLEQSSISKTKPISVRPSKSVLHPKKSEEKVADADEKLLNISAPVLESLGIDQLILLKQLQQELKSVRNKSDQKQMIIESAFVGALSSIQFNLIKDLNPSIFGFASQDHNSEIESESSKVVALESIQTDSPLRQRNQFELKIKGKLAYR